MKLVIFDRDGTLIEDRGYSIEFKSIDWTSGALSILRLLSKHSIHVAVATNQSGVARGYFTLDQVHALHTAMSNTVSAKGGRIDAFAVCPHLIGGGVAKYSVDCDCRKPKPGLINQLLEKFQVSAEDAVMIGDRETDVLAGQTAGVESFLYDGGDLFEFTNRAISANFALGTLNSDHPSSTVKRASY
jgi:D-glycero-D-manno-heptose 1,7-bisphosphate phosphatase